jgi:hypothetical protein
MVKECGVKLTAKAEVPNGGVPASIHKNAVGF